MVLIVKEEIKDKVITSLRKSKEVVFEIGKITKKDLNDTSKYKLARVFISSSVLSLMVY